MNKNSLHKFLLVVLLSLLSIQQASASHLGAADIWATYIGNTTHPLRYVIFLDVYRACEPNQSDLSDQENVTWSGGLACGFAPTNIPMTMISDDTLDQLCPNYKSLNSCKLLTSPYPGFEKRSYSDTIDLPGRCNDWVFTWEESARNAGVKNLCNPSSQSIEVNCSFNNQFNNENSPRFTVLPIPYLCVNQLDQFLNGPFDPDGDSLHVDNVQPIGCAGTTGCPCGPNGEIPYEPTTPVGGIPYTLADPIQSIAAPYTVNPITGVATFNPSLVGKFVLAFLVSKYDPATKVLLGTARRDVQVSVLTCNAPPPNIDSTPTSIANALGGPGNTIYTCPGSEVSFNVSGYSVSDSNAVFLSVDTSNSNTPGSTFATPANGTDSVNGTFTWTPGDTSVGAHILTFTSTDSTCNNDEPILLKKTITVTINVVSGINAIPKVYRKCLQSQTPVVLNVAGLPATFTYRWTLIDNISTVGITNSMSANPTVRPTDTTQYIVSVAGLPPSCKVSDTVTVNVDISNDIKIDPVTPVIFCQEGTLHLASNPVGRMPVENLPCGLAQTPPDVTHPDTTIILPALGSYGGSTSSGTSTSPFTGNASSHHQYLLRASDMINSGMVSGAINALAFSVRQVLASATYDNVTISLMCTPLKSMNADGSLLSGAIPVYTSAAPVTIDAAGFITFPFNSIYNWDTTQNLLVDVCYSNAAVTAVVPAFDYFTSGYPSSSVAFSDAASVCAGGPSSSGGNPLYEVPVIKFSYYDAPIVPFAYAWQRIYGSNMLSDSTAQNPTLYVNQSSRFYVISRGRSGCSFMDSVNIYLDPTRHPYILPIDTTVCEGTPVQLVASTAKNGYKWYQNGTKPATSLNCTNCQDVIATPDTTTKYTAVLTDSVKCVDTAFATVMTIPYPKFNLAFKDTTVKFGKSIMLAVTSEKPGELYTYAWNPPFSLDDPYIFNPTATPEAPTVYSVIVYNQFCAAYDTVNVNIDYRSNIFVPSAFTPNHDGKNDIFRITNLTYQRVIEFKIFNRWGQMIFNKTDNTGWDGTWNGTLMDIGVYNYIIRVIYPDGVEDNFQGNVTLIR